MYQLCYWPSCIRGNNYPTVKTLQLWVSTDNENFTQVGGFTFALPWQAPDGTIVTGNSPLVPAEEVISLAEPVLARYVKLIITETNNDTGVCQVSYFKHTERFNFLFSVVSLRGGLTEEYLFIQKGYP